LLGRVVGDVARVLGPRADEAHVPDEHVPELRQLVDLVAPQDTADGRHASVAGARDARAGLRGALDHAPELQKPERPPAPADALAPVEGRAARGRADEKGNRAEERREDKEGDARDGDVEQPPHRAQARCSSTISRTVAMTSATSASLIFE